MKNSNLVKLIKSLRKNEKRYIAIYLSRHKNENNILKLYNVIKDNDVITDEIIAKQIADKKFISQLKINKHNLYFLMLDALHNFHLKSSVYGEVLKLLHQAEILSAKGLIVARAELLNKAGKIADKYELTELKLEILRLKNLEIGDKTVSQNIYKETKGLAKQILRDNDLKVLNNNMSLYQRKIGKRLSVFQIRHIETQMSQTIKNQHFSEKTFFNSFFYFRILSLLNSMLGNVKESYKYDMKVLALFKDKAEMKELQIWQERYISSLSRLITSASLSGNNGMFSFIVDEINNLDISDKRKSFADINITDIYLQLGEFEQSAHLVKSIEKNIDFYNKNLGSANRTALYFNLAVLNFGLEEYARSLNWINAIINSLSDDSEEMGINNIVRILRLILYYELGRLDVLEYYLRSTYRYIEKQKRQYKFDKVLLDHLRKTIAVYDENEKTKKIMEQTRNSLARLTKIKIEQQIISYFDFISWLDSRLQNRKFSDLVKERVRSKFTKRS